MTEDLIDPKSRLILVVDDDEGVRAILEHILTREGFRVEMAKDGEEGLKKVDSVNPDLLVLDLMLPRYGGFEILRELQSAGKGSLPVVVITGRYTDRTTSDMIRQESNVSGFLEKPLQPAALLGIIHRILKTKQG